MLSLELSKFFQSLASFIQNIDSSSYIPLDQPLNSIETAISRPKIHHLNSPQDAVSTLESPVSVSEFVWEQKHDEILYRTAIDYKHDWKKISRRVNILCKKQVPIIVMKNRMTEIKKKNERRKQMFTSKDDKKLLEEVKANGHNWREISVKFSGRDPLNLKNRYYYLKKNKLIR